MKDEVYVLENGYDELKRYLFNRNTTVDVTNVRFEDCKSDMVYFRIYGIGKDDNFKMDKILYGLYGLGQDIHIIYKFDLDGVQVYIGIKNKFEKSLLGILNGFIADNASLIVRENITEEYYQYSMFLQGDSLPLEERKEDVSMADILAKGLYGEKFAVSVYAVPEHNVIESVEMWNEIACLAQSYNTYNETVNSGYETMSREVHNSKIENYIELLNKFSKKYNEALKNGLWSATIQCFADEKSILNAMKGLICAYSSDMKLEYPGPLKAYDIEMQGFSLTSRLNINRNISICLWQDMNTEKNIKLSECETELTGGELSGIVEFPRKDFFGFSVRECVDFDVSGKKQGSLLLGKIIYKGRPCNIQYQLDVNMLNRHALIAGLTGSGKTNTIKNLILSLKNDKNNIPFMVIEPAKKEYWQLYKSGINSLNVFSIGTLENGYCINPFEAVGNVSLQTHIDYVFSAFKASFIMYPPMPYVLEQAIYEIYEDCGWDIKTGINYYGKDIYPTIENLYYKIPVVIKNMGYDSRMQHDLNGSLQARIHSMRIGVKGDTLNVKKSYPLEELLKRNVVVELENIGDEDVKAFIISLLLVQLSEIRMSQNDSQNELRHLLLLEEAHRILKNIVGGTGENADPRANAVEMFCNMLAELRSKGQGFVIIDQIPSKLAVDTIKNTNLKIVHRIVSEDDRTLIGNCMNMTNEQIAYLSTLDVGVAAVYTDGDIRPKLIKPKYVGEVELNERKDVTHDEVLHICRFKENNDNLYFNCRNLKNKICSLCPFGCNGNKRNGLYGEFSESYLEKRIKEFSENPSQNKLEQIIYDIATVLKRSNKSLDLIYCYLSIWVESSNFTEEYINIIYECVQKVLKNLTNSID